MDFSPTEFTPLFATKFFNLHKEGDLVFTISHTEKHITILQYFAVFYPIANHFVRLLDKRRSINKNYLLNLLQVH